MIFSVAYQDRKSILFIESIILIYSDIYRYTYRVLGIIFLQSLPLYIEIYLVGDNRIVNTSRSLHISDQLGTEDVC